MKISVVISTWNRPIQLRHGLNTLLAQDPPPDEIIVVDDGSVDEGQTKGVCRAIKEQAKVKGIDFRYIYLDHPAARISSYPRNVGLRESSNEIVIFTEPEALHVGNTIKQMKEKIEMDPQKVYIATQVWTMGWLIWQDLTPDEFLNPERIINHKYAQLLDPINTENTKAPNSDWAITGQKNAFAGYMFGALKEHWVACRGFDEEFVGYGWDDSDLRRRTALYLAKQNLEKITHSIILSREVWCNDIVVIHQWHEKNYPYDLQAASEKTAIISVRRIEIEREHRANLDNENWGRIMEKGGKN